MQLIYRGQIIEYTPRPVTTYDRPSVVNWRYQTADNSIHPVSAPTSSYKPPRAINWRWQIAG